MPGQPPTPARIDLKLRELNQLFNSLDPSPFLDRDLDRDAEEFIVSSAREAHGARAFELVVHLGTPPDPVRAAETPAAVRHYFAVRAEMKRRELRQLLRRGQTALLVGLAFLSVCLLLSANAAKLAQPTLAHVLGEGLTIVGWVAMWRPLEIFLYDWWPLYSLRRVKRRIREAPVEVREPD